MEFIASKKIRVLTPNAVDDVEFTLSPGFAQWTLVIFPVNHAGSPNDSTVDVQYWVPDRDKLPTDESAFASTNPPTGATCVTGKANVITRTDSIMGLKLVFTNGATPPDSGMVVALFGLRIIN